MKVACAIIAGEQAAAAPSTLRQKISVEMPRMMPGVRIGETRTP